LIYALVVAAFVFVNGVAFNGLIVPHIRALTTMLLTLVILLWLFVRWRGRWAWRVTPLDLAVGLWLVAFAVSLAANSESWRRILLGLWFALFYVGVWYLLCDLLANDRLKREGLVDAVLIAGAMLIVIGFVQSRDWAFVQLPLMLSGALSFDLPRPGSLLGNPNFLGIFLAIAVPLAFGRGLRWRGIGRFIMAVYCVAGLVLLLLTFSRGSWLAFGGALIVLLALLFGGRLRPSLVRAWWARQTTAVRLGMGAAALLVIGAGIVVGLFFVLSFSQSGRSLDLRTYIYDAAVRAFVERPLTGYGHFTFGRSLARDASQPPLTPHNHAHNIALNTAAELGVVGLVALVALVLIGTRSMWHNWRTAPNESDRIAYASAVAAVTAFAVHHLVDVSAMNPAIALTGLFVLLAAVYPTHKPPASRRATVQGVGVAALWLVLIGTGIWTARVYGDYVAVLSYAVGEDDPRGAAERLETIIAADPQMAAYHYQQGMFYGLAVADGDEAALAAALAAFERYTSLEPDYAIGWANLGALRWQADDQSGAVEAMSRAFDLAPRGWNFGHTLGTYLEAVGDPAGAAEAYARTLRETPNAVLSPVWGATDLQRAAADAADRSPFAATIERLDTGDGDAAAESWRSAPEARANISLRYAVDALVALAADDAAGALEAIGAADALDVTEQDSAWVLLAQARYAAFNGEADSAAERLESAWVALERGRFDPDYAVGANIHYIQFLRYAVPRMFVPQVGYPLGDPVLLHLLSAEEGA
jgi:O-antigen ligase/tetratricopeptide (TPR) repeat protein